MSDIDINDVAVEAYTYLYPLVVMEVTRRQIQALNAQKFGPQNLFIHNRSTATDKWRSVARPNIDTLFSSGWIDLSTGPAYMTLPASGDRYHMFQMLDMWTDTYAVVGSRTIGSGGVRAKIVGPGWYSEPLDDADVLVMCPTATTWIIGRTYAQAGTDIEGARVFLDGSIITSTSPDQFVANTPMAEAVDVKTAPVAQVDALTPDQFFEIGSALLLREGQHTSDGSIQLRMRKIGFNLRSQFYFSEQNSEVQAALTAASGVARRNMRDSKAGTDFPCWTTSSGSIGYYGNNYLRRALIARYGLAANPLEDAVYVTSVSDIDGLPLQGTDEYVLHFSPGELPPAESFWSITAYDREGFLLPNELNRFGIRSRDDIVLNEDGSLDVYLGPTRPVASHESNWIPTIPGVIDLSIRLYTPAKKYLEGNWVPPVIQKVG
jgi:hypothetical protein